MKQIMAIVVGVALLGLLAVPALALTSADASAGVTLTIEKYLSIEIDDVLDRHIVIEGGASEGQASVSFTVKLNFFPCYYEYWCEIASGLPAGWDLSVPMGDQWCGCYHDGGPHACYHNTFTNLTGMKYFPGGLPLGSLGAKLTGVTLEDAAADYQNATIGTLYFQFQEGSSPCGD